MLFSKPGGRPDRGASRSARAARPRAAADPPSSRSSDVFRWGGITYASPSPSVCAPCPSPLKRDRPCQHEREQDVRTCGSSPGRRWGRPPARPGPDATPAGRRADARLPRLESPQPPRLPHGLRGLAPAERLARRSPDRRSRPASAVPCRDPGVVTCSAGTPISMTCRLSEASSTRWRDLRRLDDAVSGATAGTADPGPRRPA